MPTTQIQADIRDSLGQPLAGYIQIDLDYDLDNTTTSFLSVPAKVPLVNGVATFNLEPSESSFVSYQFSIYQTVSGQPDLLVREPFHATIPASSTPIKFTDLVPTGITQSALDGSLSAIARRLVADNVFWARFQDELLQLKGAYSPSAWYQRGNMVFYQGGSYVFISRIAATGIAPTAGQTTSYWMPTALPGQTVLNAIDPSTISGKADKTYVDTQLAAKVGSAGAILTGATSGDNLPTNQNDNRLVYASWVQSIVKPVSDRITPIGSMLAFAGSGAPAGWLFCDGATVSRTTYAALYAILGSAWNTGGEDATNFRLPDLRGRVPFGVDAFVGSSTGAANRISLLAQAGSGGSRTKTLTTAQLPAHSHAGAGGSNFYNQKAGGGSATISLAAGNDVLSQPQTDPTGSGSPIDILPPYVGINYIIFHGVI